MRTYNNSKSKTIINHIAGFLDFCKKENGLSLKTIENYNRFLKSFVIYLKQSNKEYLLPHQLSLEDIKGYKTYLLKIINPRTKKPITNTTKNLYLIALRNLISYFNEKEISSLLPSKITLLKENKSSNNKILNSDQMERLISSPDTSKPNGLRDRVILEIILFTGLKMLQIVSLNREQIKYNSKTKTFKINIFNGEIYLNKKISNWIKKYIKNRKDNNRALFINYQKRKDASRRLTIRSIERMVRKHINDNNLPILTPEDLRNTYINHLLNQTISIKSIFSHKALKINKYQNKQLSFSCKHKNDWNEVENAIHNEINWLKEKILTMPNNFKKSRILEYCDYFYLRKIAILIASGKIKAIEYRSKNNTNLWYNNKRSNEKINHGKEWHKKTMNAVANYFKLKGYKINLEPNLSYGRADLKANNIYIEIGTVSLFKIWYNLSTMKNNTFLIIPTEKDILEFTT